MARRLCKTRSVKASESSSAPPKPCRLLSLPAELRTRIYEYALFPTHSQPVIDTELERYRRPARIIMNSRSKPRLARSTGFFDCYIWKRDRSDPTLQRPALLAVNKQVRAEASEIFYGKAVFRVPLALDLSGSFGVRMAQKWLASLQDVDREFVKAIKLELHWNSQQVFVTESKAECMTDGCITGEEDGDIHMFADDKELMARLELPVADESKKAGWKSRKAREFSWEAKEERLIEGDADDEGSD